MYSSAHPHQGQREDRYPDRLERERGYERSRSPQREGRERYTDRDREDYQSPPRDRSRSRSPFYGAPPNRNVILEGLPMEMTQEDVGHPILTPCGFSQPIQFFPKCSLSIYLEFWLSIGMAALGL
jgi:hypothetical protein